MRRLTRILVGLVLAAGAAAAGCSSSQTSTNPSPTKCQVSIGNAATTVGAGGGTTTVSVTAQPECAWTVTANVSWIAGVTPASGQGNGQVEVRVAANTDTVARQGTIQINGTDVRVSQEGAPCVIDVSPHARAVAGTGGTTTFSIATGSGCTWSATSNDSWITLTAGRTGTGNGTVTLSVAATSGDARVGTVTIAGQTVTIAEEAGNNPANCTYTVAPLAFSLPVAGGPQSVAVTAGNGCSWTAASSVPWVSVTAGASGSANGSVTLSVAPNTGASRVGTVAIAGQSVTITQAAAPVPCAFTLSATSQTVGAGAGTGTVTVSTTAGCGWTAASNASWLTITTGTSGDNSGPVSFDVAANTGALRTGTLTIAGQTYTVTQSAVTIVCSYAIDPANQPMAAAGGTANVAVTTTSTCAWTATSNVSWIVIDTGESGTGNGTVNFTVEANTSTTARTGMMTIAGRTSRVNQAAAAPSCAYAIAPTSQSIASSGGAGTAVAVTTAGGCAWTAVSNATWITVTRGATGSGNGTVNFTVAANTGPARTDTLTIAGQTFTLTQAAAPTCNFGIAPTSQSVGAGGGAGTAIAVTTAGGCAWTAVSNATWITVTNGASGSGNGTVNFTVAANTGPARTGTLTIAGQTFTVTQAAAPACTFGIAPISQSVGAGGGAGTVIAVTTAGGCAWTAVSNVTWITVTNGASGSGNGTVNFTVAANTGPARTGTLTIAGQTFTVTQAAAPTCTFGIAPTSQSVGAGGGAGTAIAVTATGSGGCAWTAVSNATWITVTGGASGSGNGTVNFTVAANTGPARTGTITIGGQTFTVTQTAAPVCTFGIAPTSQSVGAGGGAGTVIAVTTAGGCAWTAVSNVTWITVTGGASGSGNGTVNFTVAANTGPARNGTLTIGGQTFTVTQAAAPTCTFGIAPTSQSVGAGGGAGTAIAVTATGSGGCAWTAVSNAIWITVTGGASGSGNGTVNFTVAANTGPARTGTITIGGQLFTVNQAVSCTYAIAPTTGQFATLGGTGTVAVTAPAGCAWTATSNTPAWILVTGGANGTGDGTVTIAVLPNVTLVNRNGTVTIANQTFAVSQSGL